MSATAAEKELEIVRAKLRQFIVDFKDVNEDMTGIVTSANELDRVEKILKGMVHKLETSRLGLETKQREMKERKKQKRVEKKK
jgi:hypothetical protein